MHIRKKSQSENTDSPTAIKQRGKENIYLYTDSLKKTSQTINNWAIALRWSVGNICDWGFKPGF